MSTVKTTLKQLLENEDEILASGASETADDDIDYSEIPRMDDPTLWANAKLIDPRKPIQVVVTLTSSESGDWVAFFSSSPDISATGETPQVAFMQLGLVWESLKLDSD